ncbi:MAG: type II toxin-antitoxin system VapC family toxin [Acidobacteriota bacterium]
MNRAFVDTAGWYAYIRADDPDHPPVMEAFERREGRLITSSFVFDELVTLVRGRLGHKAAVKVGETLRSPDVVELVRLSVEDEEQAWLLFSEHTDKDYSFTDCTSFVLMHRLGLAVAITTDHHFQQAGFRTDPE